MKSFKVMRLAQQDVIRFGKIAQGNLTGTILTFGTSLVIFRTVQGDLRVGRIHRFATGAAFGTGATAVGKLLHAFLNATRHDGGIGVCMTLHKGIKYE